MRSIVLALAFAPALALVLVPISVSADAPSSVATTGPASFAARVTTGADGGFSATLTSCGTKTASTDGVGLVVLDANEAFRFGFGVTGHGSPDRTVTQLGPLLDDVAVTYPSYGPICPYSALTVTIGGAPFTTHYLVMWAAGLDGATTFTVNGAAADIRTGAAVSLGDPDLERASANVQVQRRVSGFNGLGVKIVHDAAIDLDVAQRAWGFWGYNDAKFVCASGTCAGPALADQACLQAAGTTCDTRISWSGPSGGDAGSNVHTLLGEPAGPYTFRVDSKVDAYNPGGGAYVPPGVLVFPGENYGFLSLADVSLPG